METKFGKAARPELLIEYTWNEKKYQLWTYRRDTLLGGAFIKPQPDGDDSPEITPEDAKNRAQRILNRYEVNSEQPCWVNKNDPSKAILRKWRYWSSLCGFYSFGIVLCVLGITILRILYEKHTARKQILKRYEENHENWKYGTEFLHVLEKDKESWKSEWILLGIVIWMVFSTTMTVVFLEQNDFLGLLISVPLILIGFALFGNYCRILLFRHFGQTDVEMKFQPQPTGSTGQILVLQQKPIKVDLYSVILRCRELTTFTEGTNTRTDSKNVFQQTLYQESDFRVETELPFRRLLDFSIQENAPVSFKAEHNEIRWEIVITGTRRKHSVLERIFPFKVLNTEITENQV
jgi:hypothetical protein